MWKSIVAIAGVVTVASIAGSVNHAQQAVIKKVDFATEVLPILRQNCNTCHGPKEQKNGFRLDRRKDALAAGRSPSSAQETPTAAACTTS